MQERLSEDVEAPPTQSDDAAVPDLPQPSRAAVDLQSAGLGGSHGLDRGAASLDATTSILNRVGTAPFSFSAQHPAWTLGPLSLNGTLTTGVTAEQRTGFGQGSENWEMGARLGGTLTGTLGHPPLGRFINFDYAASLQLGGRAQTSGTVDQIFTLEGHYDFSKLKLSLAGEYSHSAGPDRDVGRATDRDLIDVSLTSDYAISKKSSVDLTIADRSSEFSEGISSEEVTARLFFNRKLTQKTELALGGTLGALKVDEGENQTFEQINLRLRYQLLLKLNFSGSVGYEFRQVGEKNTATPVFDGGVTYALRPTTNLALNFSRAVTNSAERQSTNYVSTTLTASASQQLGSRASCSLSVGFQNAEYGASGRAGNSGRKDNLYFARPSLNWRLGGSLGLSIFYSFSNNQSNERAFSTQQAGLSAVYSF